MDLANLTLGVDSGQVKKAGSELDKLRAIALGTAKSVDEMNESLEETEQQAEESSESVSGFLGKLGSLKGVIAGVFGGFSLAALGNMADTWSDVSSRVGLAINDMDGAGDAMARLTQTARLTYSSLNQTAEGFIRNSLVLTELKKSTQEQLDYTEALNLALVASGAKGQAALLVQESLSRSMSMGAMRGQELNNILNYSGEVAKALAEEMGTTTAGLREMAMQGKITGEVIFNTLTKRLDYFRERAEMMPATLGDGFLLIGNAVTALVGSLDKLGGVSEYIAGLMVGLADGILFVAQNSETVAKVINTIAPVMLVAFGPSILAAVTSLAAAIGTQLVAAINLSALAIRAHPLMTIASVITLVISAMYQWRDSFPAIGAAFDWLWDKASYVLETIKLAIESIPFLNWMFNGGDASIEINADTASAKIASSFSSGGKMAGSEVEKGLERGARTGASMFDQAAQAAVARYEKMNGKLGELIVKSHQTGATYVYNAYTGAVKEAAQTTAAAMVQAGAQSAEAIQKSMSSGGQQAAAEFEAAGVRLSGWLVDYFVNRLDNLITQQVRYIQAETAKMQAEANKLNAEARALKGGSGFKSTGAGSSGSSGGSSNYKVGMPTAGNYAAAYGITTPFERRAQEQQAQQEAAAAAAANANPTTVVTQIKNVMDPNAMVDIIDTNAGHQAIVNVIKFNRDEIAALLGSG